MTTFRIRAVAERDVDATAEHYAARANLDVSLRFLSAVETTFQWIAEHAESGAPVLAFSPSLAGLRFRPVEGFEKHLDFYTCDPDRIEVVRVLHGARYLGAELGEDDSKRSADTSEPEDRDR